MIDREKRDFGLPIAKWLIDWKSDLLASHIGTFAVERSEDPQTLWSILMLQACVLVRIAERYKQQVFKIIDPVKTEVRFNSEWLGALGAEGMIRLAAKYTLARILERDDVRKRFFFFQAEDGIRDLTVTGVQTCALPI